MPNGTIEPADFPAFDHVELAYIDAYFATLPAEAQPGKAAYINKLRMTSAPQDRDAEMARIIKIGIAGRQT